MAANLELRNIFHWPSKAVALLSHSHRPLGQECREC